MSNSASGKPIKKARVVDEEQAATPRDLFSAHTQPGDIPSEGLGGTPDLAEELAHLRGENSRLQLEVEKLREQLNRLSLEPDAAAGVAVVAQALVSDEAARKRLARLCKPNSQGTHGSNRFLKSSQMNVSLIQVHPGPHDRKHMFRTGSTKDSSGATGGTRPVEGGWSGQNPTPRDLGAVWF